MGPERLVQEALEAGGDPASAFLWRRVCRDLDGEVRIAVISRDEAVTGRMLRVLSHHDRVSLVPLRLETSGDVLHATLGATDRLLSVHALIWATPATAPLGAEERAAMAAIIDAGAPARRAVVLADEAAVAQMSDHPEVELSEARERLVALCASEWEVQTGAGVGEWINALGHDRVGLTQSRRRAVAGMLLEETRRRADRAVVQATSELDQVQSLLAVEEEKLEAERRKGRRTAAHLLGAMRRQTEQLLVDLRGFLLALEEDLQAQVDGVGDLDTVRRALPHWLHHVVERWISDRLSSWRAAVLHDLVELALEPEDLERAELLVPALHPAPMRPEVGWGQRLGVTAALGGGAALLAFGMWIPGLVAVTGGIAWSALGWTGAQAASRRALVEAATDTVRQMSRDADRLLRDQIKTLEEALDQLGEARAAEVQKARADERGALDKEAQLRAGRLAALEQSRVELGRRIAQVALEGHSSGLAAPPVATWVAPGSSPTPGTAAPTPTSGTATPAPTSGIGTSDAPQSPDDAGSEPGDEH